MLTMGGPQRAPCTLRQTRIGEYNLGVGEIVKLVFLEYENIETDHLLVKGAVRVWFTCFGR